MSRSGGYAENTYKSMDYNLQNHIQTLINIALGGLCLAVARPLLTVNQ